MLGSLLLIHKHKSISVITVLFSYYVYVQRHGYQISQKWSNVSVAKVSCWLPVLSFLHVAFVFFSCMFCVLLCLDALPCVNAT